MCARCVDKEWTGYFWALKSRKDTAVSCISTFELSKMLWMRWGHSRKGKTEARSRGVETTCYQARHRLMSTNCRQTEYKAVSLFVNNHVRASTTPAATPARVIGRRRQWRICFCPTLVVVFSGGLSANRALDSLVFTRNCLSFVESILSLTSWHARRWLAWWSAWGSFSAAIRFAIQLDLQILNICPQNV